MVPQDPHDAQGTGSVMSRACATRGDEMIVVRREEQHRRANVMSPVTNIKAFQEPQTIDVSLARSVRGRLDELLYLRPMRVRRVQPERREVTHTILASTTTRLSGAGFSQTSRGNWPPQDSRRSRRGHSSCCFTITRASIRGWTSTERRTTRETSVRQQSRGE